MMVHIKSEYYDSSSVGSVEDLYDQTPAKRLRVGDGYTVPDIDPQTYLVANSRRPTGPRKQARKQFTAAEAEKLKLRRERNKEAAAKCRKRREDYTSKLITETEDLEETKADLEDEIETLQRQKEQLQFLLQAHSITCPLHRHSNTTQPTKHQQYSLVSNPESVIKTQPTATSRAQTGPRPTDFESIPLSVTEDTGVAIKTPSTEVSLFTLDPSLSEGHITLTSGMCAPVSVAMPTTNSSSLLKSRNSIDGAFLPIDDFSSHTLLAL